MSKTYAALFSAAFFAVTAFAQTGSGDKATIAATQAAVTASKEDAAAVGRGAKLFAANCASCHAGAEDDHRLYAASVVGTDPLRAAMSASISCRPSSSIPQ